MFKIPFTNFSIGRNAAQTDGGKIGRPISWGSLFGGGRTTDVSSYKISLHSLFSIYRNNSDIRNCVRLIQDNVGKSGWDLLGTEDESLEATGAMYKQIDLILNSAESTHQNFHDLTKRIVRDLEVCGNSYIVILKNDKGEPLGLQPADSRSISIIADKYGIVRNYVQEIMGEQRKIYEPEDIIHIKGEDDPNHEVFGMGNLEPIIWEARTDNAAMISNFKFFENNAIPSALYILDERLSPEQIKTKLDAIKENFGGANNRHKAGAILGVKDIKMMNVTQKDMEFLAGRKFSTEKIAASFGVPIFLLGYTGQVNNNNGIELEENFVTKTVIPVEKKIADAINSQFLEKLFGENLVFFTFREHKFERAQELETRAIKLFEKGIITLRDAKKMIGREISDEDEKEENIDKHLLHSGASAVLLEDVGIDPALTMDEDVAL